MDTRDSHEPKVPARLTPSRAVPSPARAPAPASEQSAAQTVSFRTLLRGVTRFWWQTLTAWIIGTTVLVTLVQTQVKPVYEATAMLRAEPGTQNLLNIQVQTSDSMRSYLETQVQLITSDNVLLAVVADPAVEKLTTIRKAEDPVLELKKLLQAVVVPNTYLIQVALRSTSRDDAAAIVNKVMEVYHDSQGKYADDITRNQIRRIEIYKEGLANHIEDKKKEWLRLVAENGNANNQVHPSSEKNTDTKESVSIEEYRSVRRQLNQTTLDLIQAEALLARRLEDTKGLAPENSEGKLERQLADRLRVDPDLTKILEDFHKAENTLREARRLTKSPVDPAIIRNKQRMEEASSRYYKLRDTKEKSYRAMLVTQQVSDPDRGLREAEEKVQALRAAKANWEKEMSRLEIAQKQDATVSVKILFVSEEREELRNLLAEVSRRLEQLRFESQGEDRITVINPARVPGMPVSDPRKKLIAAIPVGLLGVLIGLGILVELRSGRVAHPDELASLMPIEVFSIPPLPMQRSDRKGRNQAELIEVFAQRLDHLRVALGIDTRTGQGGRCVMITSATGGEGKTTLSAQLAGRCASAGVRTLLIDADLRRTTLSRMLDVPLGLGLVNVLEGKIDVDAAIVNIDGAGSLFLLPAGTSEQDPSRVLRGPDLGQMLEHLRQDFELILIDTPPVLPVPDALTIGQWIDGTLIAARSDASRYSLVGRASRMLASARIPLLGIVVNGVRVEAGYADYAYRYKQPVAAESSGMPDDPRPEAGAPR